LIVLLCNITLAILSKLAPQFNLFSVGINIELLLGLFMIYLTFTAFVYHSKDSISLYLNKASIEYLGAGNGR
jgi:flagellar biosynthesis protein FliR